MGGETLPKPFIFNEKMDKDTLYGLYAGDYVCVEEIFATTLQYFDADFGALQTAYEAGQVEDVKKAVHKIKPTFGFMGLLETQALCKAFEDKCATTQSVVSITKEYTHIKSTLLEAKDLIQSEYLRLKAFNANPL